MDLKVNIRQVVKGTFRQLEPSRAWPRGLADENDGSLGRPGTGETGTRQYSYSAECGCPGDCLRDHENE